ncbi:metallothionein-like protein 1 [Rosa rugosa]|uniref:metallothionein-like protein 1 n=1 Tax=Rosa rugosa TaxID=74645 RepID=UPI002B409E08|nr:metallothionein-like protein 1 [Rosa rugosa]
MSGCGSTSCKCGSGCKCGSSCNCGNYPDLESSTTATIIAGVPSTNVCFEESEMSFGAENGCKCGQSCSCTSCGCHK